MHYWIGEGYRQRGELARALEIFTGLAASRADRTGALAQSAVARVREEQGRPEEAAEEYLKVYFLFPEMKDLAPEGLYQAGRLYPGAGPAGAGGTLAGKAAGRVPGQPPGPRMKKREAMSEWVEFLDTTLRDGNKLPFVVLSVAERLAIARQLGELGVDIIEAGYPAASAEEREALVQIAREVREPWIAALAKATPQDVETVLEALAAAARPHLHIFLPMSEVFLRGVLGKSGAECLKLIEQSIKAARGVRVQFSLAEVGEAEESLLLEAAQAAGEAGAQVLSLADTNGCLHPERVRELVGRVRAVLQPEVLVGVHQHNDLGLATACTLAALEAGARHVEVTLSGIGGRAGNTPLEEVALGLEVFAPRLGLAHRLRLDRLAGASALLARLTGVPMHPNKPVLGRQAFEAGRGADARQALDERAARPAGPANHRQGGGRTVQRPGYKPGGLRPAPGDARGGHQGGGSGEGLPPVPGTGAPQEGRAPERGAGHDRGRPPGNLLALQAGVLRGDDRLAHPAGGQRGAGSRRRAAGAELPGTRARWTPCAGRWTRRWA